MSPSTSTIIERLPYLVSELFYFAPISLFALYAFSVCYELASLECKLEGLREAGPHGQLQLAAPQPTDPIGEEIRAQLESLDVVTLTPREALDLLYELAQRGRGDSD